MKSKCQVLPLHAPPSRDVVDRLAKIADPDELRSQSNAVIGNVITSLAELVASFETLTGALVREGKLSQQESDSILAALKSDVSCSTADGSVSTTG